MAKRGPGKRETELYRQHRQQSRDIWAEALEPIAVQAVWIVTKKLSKDGKLFGYAGIEAAREIRDLFTEHIIDDLWSRQDSYYRRRKWTRRKRKPTTTKGISRG